jgi:hypothetical protein
MCLIAVDQTGEVKDKKYGRDQMSKPAKAKVHAGLEPAIL